MKVLMVIRPDADTNFGGDRVQMIETAKALRNLGIHVAERVGHVAPSDYDGIDIVHLFNLQTFDFTLQEARKAKAAGKVIALSTIWWELPADAAIENSRRWALLAKILGRSSVRNVLARRQEREIAPTRRLQREIVAMSDMLLPNSWLEAKELRKLDAHDRIAVVPNGIDTKLFDPALNYPRPAWVPQGEYLICVGRIEAGKGQRKLAKAAKAIGLPCILAGDQVDDAYAAACEALGATLVGRKAQEELAGAYQHARLYVQPSLRETPGLAALEAAAMGCPVMITKNGSTREYFGDSVAYIDPLNALSIDRTLRSELDSARREPIQNYIREHYSWHCAGNATASAYSIFA